ncbi:MAG: HNH endonuclease signature motif containing protein [Myxococcota bacterium]
MDRNAQLVEDLCTHARAGTALDLRAALVISWFKRQDLRPLGYASYRVFAAQHVDWGDSWMRDLVRLVESPLERVKAAACRGEVPLREAVRAPSETDVENEEAWLASHEPACGKRAPRPGVNLSGDALETIHAARERARIYMGGHADDAAADRYILREWRRGDPEATRREAMAPRPAPPPMRPLEVYDPATALLGRWREPTSLEDGLAQLREVNACRRVRVLTTGTLYRTVLAERAWRGEWASVGEMTRALGLEQRTLQRAKKLVEALEPLPDTSAAVACGEISLDEARKIASVATEETEEDWLKIVPWYTPPDFARLVELASRGVDIRPVAQRVIDRFVEVATNRDRVTFKGVERQMPAPRHQAVHPDLPKAAVWFLAHATLPPQRGCGRVKEKAGFRCGNPEDRHPSLRMHVHHVDHRAHGGGNDERNQVPACPPCHLRGFHGGFIRLEDRGDVRIWHYAGGRRVFEWMEAP